MLMSSAGHLLIVRPLIKLCLGPHELSSFSLSTTQWRGLGWITGEAKGIREGISR